MIYDQTPKQTNYSSPRDRDYPFLCIDKNYNEIKGTAHLIGYFQGKLNTLLPIHWF